MKEVTMYSAPWCISCKGMKQHLFDCVKITGHHVKIIDIEENPQDGAGITQLPYFKVTDDYGERTKSGAMQRMELLRFLKG